MYRIFIFINIPRIIISKLLAVEFFKYVRKIFACTHVSVDVPEFTDDSRFIFCRWNFSNNSPPPAGLELVGAVELKNDNIHMFTTISFRCSLLSQQKIPNVSVGIDDIAFWNLRRHRSIQCRRLLMHLSGCLVLKLILGRYDYFVGERISSRAFGGWRGRTGTFTVTSTSRTLINGRLWWWLECLNCNRFWWFWLNWCSLLDWWKSLEESVKLVGFMVIHNNESSITHLVEVIVIATDENLTVVFEQPIHTGCH